MPGEEQEKGWMGGRGAPFQPLSAAVVETSLGQAVGSLMSSWQAEGGMWGVEIKTLG